MRRWTAPGKEGQMMRLTMRAAVAVGCLGMGLAAAVVAAPASEAPAGSGQDVLISNHDASDVAAAATGQPGGQPPSPAPSLPQLGKAPLEAVIAALTLEEKVSLLTGKLPPGQAVLLQPFRAARAATHDDAAGALAAEVPAAEVPAAAGEIPAAEVNPPGPVVGQTQDKVPGAAGTTFAVPRLGIPSLVLADGPAGVRLAPQRPGEPSKRFFATAFPVASALATSWDPALARRVGEAIGAEARAYGIDVMLAPALNLHRHPLGGRNFEYYAEDPFLSGRMAAAMVQGIQSQGVGASIKHFAVNNHEWHRDTIDVKVGERPLRELYLRGFEMAVQQGQPWTVMSSYNRLNGTYTSESTWLLETVLRQQWGFEGLVMSDWFGGRDATAQMQAGNDLLMPGSRAQQQAIIAAVRSGRLDEKVLDRNVGRLLALVQKSLVFAGHRADDRPDLKAHAQLAREAAADGMVLLKNDAHALPLSAGAQIALFGNQGYHTLIGGSGSGDVHEAHAIPLAQGLRDAGFGLDEALSQAYAAHLATDRTRQQPGTWQEVAPATALLAEYRVPSERIEAAARDNDLAIVTLGRHSGEFADRTVQDDFELTEVETALLASVSRAFKAQGKKVVVVLNIGGVIETARWHEQADAVLLGWQPGQEAGHAMADVLSGRINPSGKLADSFVQSLRDLPADRGFPGTVPAGDKAGERATVSYDEGMRVGYRAFDAHAPAPVYPFGHGLSYTHFVYQQLSLSHPQVNEMQTVTVRVTNTGKRAGREVVQLYLSAPRPTTTPAAPTVAPGVAQGGMAGQGATMAADGGAWVPELRAFAKTPLLQPGESAVVSLPLGIRELARFDAQQQAWVADAGTYGLAVGASSRDIRLQARFVKPVATRIGLRDRADSEGGGSTR